MPEKNQRIEPILAEIAAITDKSKREEFAQACGTSLGMLQQVGYGQRSCSLKLAIGIDKATKGKVKFEKLCPDIDWVYVINNLPDRLKKK